MTQDPYRWYSVEELQQEILDQTVDWYEPHVHRLLGEKRSLLLEAVRHHEELDLWKTCAVVATITALIAMTF